MTTWTWKDTLSSIFCLFILWVLLADLYIEYSLHGLILGMLGIVLLGVLS